MHTYQGEKLTSSLPEDQLQEIIEAVQKENPYPEKTLAHQAWTKCLAKLSEKVAIKILYR
jgi:hypothetical protein